MHQRPVTKTVFAVFVLFYSLTAPSLHAEEEHDIEFSKTIEFTIKGNKPEKLKLRAETLEVTRFLSERSTLSPNQYIFEHPTAVVSDIEAKLSGEKVSGRHISFTYLPQRDVFLSDYKLHTVHFPGGVEIGDILRVSYDEKFRDIAYMPIIYAQNIDHYRELKVIVNHPKELHVDFELSFSRQESDYRIVRKSEKRTELIVDSIPYHPGSIAYFPLENLNLAILTTLSWDGIRLNPTTAEDMLKWFDRNTPLTPTVNADYDSELPDIDSGMTTTQKLSAIHDFVRSNIRYIADHKYPNMFLPHDPITTLERMYGDCKDRAYLVTALARRHGIPVSMALINTDFEPVFENIQFWLYNHVICVYRDSLGSTYFDPTSRYREFGNVSQSLMNKPTLVLDPEGAYIDTVRCQDSTVSLQVDVHASLSAPDSGTATIRLRKDHLATARHALNDLTGTDLQNVLSSLIAGYFRKLSLESFTLVSDKPGEMIFESSADLSDFIVSSKSRRYIVKAPFIVIDSDILRRENDSLPLCFESPVSLGLNIELQTGGWESDESQITLGDGSSLSFDARVLPGDSLSHSISYNFSHNPTVVTGQDRGDCLDFYRQYLGSKNDLFIFRRSDN